MTTDRLRSDQFNKEQIQQIYNKIQQNKDVISFGTYEERIIELESSNRLLKNSMLADLKNKTFHDERPTINSILVDENYYRLLDFLSKMVKGFHAKIFKKR